MPVIDNLNLIFINIPKTGGNKVKKLITSNDEEIYNKWYNYKNEYPEKWKNYISFTVVRNPFARVVRNFQDARKTDSVWDQKISPAKRRNGSNTLKGKSFREVVDLLDELEHGGWESQYSYITNGRNSLNVDKIIKWENIKKELPDFLSKVGYNKNINTDSLLNGRIKKYRNYYDKETKEKVKQKYQKDFEIFDYSF